MNMHHSSSHSSRSSHSSSGSRHHHHHGHRSHRSSSSSHNSAAERYSVMSGLGDQYRDMRTYVVDVRSEEYRRTMIPEPNLTSVSLGVRVEPIIYPDTQEELEREVTPRFHYREEVIFDNDIFEVVSKPKLVRDGRRETFRYAIRHKYEHGTPIPVLEEDLVRVPTRLFENGAVVRYDHKRYEVVGAAFLPQEFIWEYRIKRFSSSEGGDVKRNAFESRLTRVDSSEARLTPPYSGHSRTSPKGSLSSLVDSLLFKHN
ncbi:hypothetical protein Dda_1638 [Drechslerella dactyloides]|uniref:Uncharacterized protein n=1 Tax=Drechslerella dactyloides TaxID=74499 RepID=A0AAD6NLL1_DREDA|nr:hypothetical protein Dda_1638 [Drechslerella dactyloides]